MCLQPHKVPRLVRGPVKAEVWGVQQWKPCDNKTFYGAQGNIQRGPELLRQCMCAQGGVSEPSPPQRHGWGTLGLHRIQFGNY